MDVFPSFASFIINGMNRVRAIGFCISRNLSLSSTSGDYTKIIINIIPKRCIGDR